MKKSKREVYFQMAQLFAILFSGLVISATFTSNLAINSFFAIQNNNEQINNAKNENSISHLSNANDTLGEFITFGYNLSLIIIILAIFFLIISLIFAIKGYRLR